jgi:hypothetical protein
VNILQLAVILLAVICVLDTVAVVALIRQVGILHLRIQPVAGVTGVGGPAYGSQLSLPATISELARRQAERFLVAFVSPTCGICGPLTTSFGRLAKSAGTDTGVLLVVDAGEQDARKYIHAKGVGFLPYIADKASFNDNVPGSPWVVVTDGSGKVIVSGGVNTLDNVEEMLAQAEYLMKNPPESVAPVQIALSTSEEVSEHVG